MLIKTEKMMIPKLETVSEVSGSCDCDDVACDLSSLGKQIKTSPGEPVEIFSISKSVFRIVVGLKS